MIGNHRLFVFTPFLLVVAFLSAAASDTAAQTLDPESDPDHVPSTLPSDLGVERYSPGAAFRESLFSTLIPMAVGTALVLAGSENSMEDEGEVAETAGTLLILSGSWFGPSVGLFNVGASNRAWLGIAIRTAAVGAEFALLAASVDDLDPSREAEVLATLIAVIYAGSAVVDIIATPSVARKRNAEIDKQGGTQWGVIYLPDTGPAFAVRTQF